jgi:hypothetical protein
MKKETKAEIGEMTVRITVDADKAIAALGDLSNRVKALTAQFDELKAAMVLPSHDCRAALEKDLAKSAADSRIVGTRD